MDENIIYLAIGALLTSLGGWIQSRRDRAWRLEDIRLERTREARERRIVEAEDYGRSALADFHLMMEVGHRLIEGKGDADVVQIASVMRKRIENNDKLDSRVFGGASALRSLDDESLNTSWEHMLDMYREFDEFMGRLFFSFNDDGGVIPIRNQNKWREEFELARARYVESVDSFYRSVNQARSLTT